MSEPRWSERMHGSTVSWQGLLGQRYRLVKSYWCGTNADRPDHYNDLRMPSLEMPNLRVNRNPTRAQIVTFYEGLVRYMTHWILKYQGDLRDVQRERDEALRQYQFAKDSFERSQEQRSELQHELDAARWVQQKLYKARGHRDETN